MTGNDQPDPSEEQPDDMATLLQSAQSPELGATLPPSGPAEPGNAVSIGERVRYFGDYKLLEEIARGGMGVVYKARQINLNRIVALKMILAGQLADRQDVQRFHTEAEAAANLDHPGIVPIFEIGEHRGQHYFSMAYIEGQSLAQKVVDGPLSPRHAVELVRTICGAMGYAHDRGVIHRDLKPANILIDKNGQPKVTDFGLAKKTDADSNLTGSGQILGTPAYMPPEQAIGKIDEVGPLADVYSLGAILYCLLTGRPPFQAASPMDTLIQVLEQDPVPPRTLNSLIDRDLETACLKCLEKDTNRRYQSAASFADELTRYLEGRPILARPIGRSERVWRWCKRKPLVAALSVTLALLLLAISISSPIVALSQANLARLEAEAREKSERAFGEADTQRRTAEKARDKANELLVQQYVSNGIRLQDDGDGLSAMLWFVEALRIESNDPERQQIHRLRLAAEFDRAPFLSLAAKLPGKLIGAGESLGRGVAITAEINDIKPEEIRSKSNGRFVRFWDLNSFQSLGNALPYDAQIAASAEDGSVLAIGTKTGAAVFDRNALLDGHASRIFEHVDPTACAFSVDGKILATAGMPINRDSRIKRPASLAPYEIATWNIETGEILQLIPTKQRVTNLVFSPDSELLAAATNAGVGPVQVWDTASGQQRGNDLLPGISVEQLQFSPNGKALLARSINTVRIWTVGRDSPPITLETRRKLVWDADWDPLGASVITGNSDRSARIWDAQSGRQLMGPLRHASSTGCVDFSPSGKYVATGSYDRTARIWDAQTGTPVTPPLRHSSVVEHVLFDPGNAGLVTVAFEKDQNASLRKYVFKPNATVGEVLPATDSSINRAHHGLTFSASGSFLASHSDGDAYLWKLAGTNESPRMLSLTDADVTCLVFDPREQMIATGSSQGDITIWNMEDGSEFRTLRRAGGSILGQLFDRLKGQESAREIEVISFSPSGKLLASAFENNLEIWDVARGRQLTGGPIVHPAAIRSLCFSPDGRRILTACDDGVARLWNALTGELVREGEKQGDWLLHVAFDQDGTQFLAASMDATVNVWRTGEDSAPTISRTVGGIVHAVFSPDGKLIAMACVDGRAMIVSATTGELVAPPLLHSEHVRLVEFSADGTMLLTRSDDGAARLWDVTNGLRIAKWRPRDGVIKSAAFQPDGQSIAIADDRGSVRIVRLEPDQRSLAKLTAAAEVLANQTIDALGGLRLLSTEEWHKRFVESME